MREEKAEEEEIEGEKRMDEVVTPGANGFGSDDEDMICSLLWVDVCELACTCGVHGFVMALAVWPKYDDVGVL